MQRRGFLKTILALGMAPAIVKATSLMQIVRPQPLAMPDEIVVGYDLGRPGGDESVVVVATRKKPAVIKSWELGGGAWVPVSELPADALDYLAENPHVHCRALFGGLDVNNNALAKPEKMAEVAAMRRRMGIPPPEAGKLFGVNDAPFRIWCLTTSGG